MERQPRWMRLDNAAKIYPAARRRSWSNLFRLSASFNENVDIAIMQQALDITVKRFPSIAVRIRMGMFWYYLEEIKSAPSIQCESAYPLRRMPFDNIRKCAFRVICHQNRVAVEFFHAVTDGNGGMVFFKTLLSEYVFLKYGVKASITDGVLNIDDQPKNEELEDSFLKNDGPVSSSRKEATAYRLRGSIEPDGYLNLITGILDADEVLAMSHKYGVSLTAFLASVMVACIAQMQNRRVKNKARQKPVKILIPVNLRPFFKSSSLRNFALYITPGIDPRMGDYSFEEILRAMHHQMGMEITEKQMAARIATNVKTERMFIVKIMPLFIKNLVMKMVFNMVGERKSCITISNLGAVTLPEEMLPYINRMDFILGAQSMCTNNCGVLSYGGKLYISFLRTIKETELEKEFFCYLRKLGLHVKVESNRR